MTRMQMYHVLRSLGLTAVQSFVGSHYAIRFHDFKQNDLLWVASIMRPCSMKRCFEMFSYLPKVPA